ncbi:MAG: biotin transporter BioY [Candidatus Borkfalkiaceae bacterium]|nr:biotin transporter BioY [Christensenellaceae bacterium]
MKVRDMVRIALFVAIIAVCSWLTVQIPAVPFTMQTFAVFLACFMLGWWKALISVSIYVLLGLVGAPVFSGFRGGVSALVGPTGGYILGFIAQCLVYGLITICFGKYRDNVFVKIGASVVGLAVLYTFGTLWYAFIYTNGTTEQIYGILLKCVVPFIIPDLAKMALAYAVSFSVNRILKTA